MKIFFALVSLLAATQSGFAGDRATVLSCLRSTETKEAVTTCVAPTLNCTRAPLQSQCHENAMQFWRSLGIEYGAMVHALEDANRTLRQYIHCRLTTSDGLMFDTCLSIASAFRPEFGETGFVVEMAEAEKRVEARCSKEHPERGAKAHNFCVRDGVARHATMNIIRSMSGLQGLEAMMKELSE